VSKIGRPEERRVTKELQEIVGGVLEACCQIISSQLETTSWAIRKNYTVKVGLVTFDLVTGQHYKSLVL